MQGRADGGTTAQADGRKDRRTDAYMEGRTDGRIGKGNFASFFSSKQFQTKPKIW